MLFTIFIFSFCSGDDVIHSTKFWSNMTKKDITASLYQKCLIFCSKILLDVLHNTSLTVLLSDLPTTFGVSFWFCLWCLICMIQQAYKYANSSSLPRLMFFELKIANISRSSGWGLGMSELPWEHSFFFVAVGLFPVELLAYQVPMVCAANMWFVWGRHLTTTTRILHFVCFLC